MNAINKAMLAVIRNGFKDEVITPTKKYAEELLQGKLEQAEALSLVLEKSQDEGTVFVEARFKIVNFHKRTMARVTVKLNTDLQLGLDVWFTDESPRTIHKRLLYQIKEYLEYRWLEYDDRL